MTENEISFYVRKAIFSVYNELGPGLLEKVYEKILVYELGSYGLKVVSQKPISIKFKDICIDSSFIADIIVEEKVIIEIKSVAEINNVHQAIIDLFKTDRIEIRDFSKFQYRSY